MRLILMISLVFGLALSLPPASFAQSDGGIVRVAQNRPKVIPIKRIEAQMARRYSGRVVGSRMRQFSKDRWVYELRVLKENGEVISVTVDAHDGRVIGTRGGRQ